MFQNMPPISSSAALSMYPPDMVLHVVHATKYPATLLALCTPPFTPDTWIVFGLVTRAVLLAGEAATARNTASVSAWVADCARLGLRAAFHTAEEVLGVAVEVLPEVATARKQGPGGAAWIGASPCL